MSGIPNPAAFAQSLAGRAAPSAPFGDGDVAVVDDALAGLDGLDELSCAERVGVFETVHERLQDILATVDDA
ncbi:hypothetical protein [Phytomonospora endophytica]|uniref:Uncharacterized protein n=1 Tax=Phytomonospora endophytica TaxID=714109 RepID=A0A841FLY8_9ACTN|nr:hypothetical protein [Phytomonospora endophytica]MBB6035933.1 hypothetical protein [Phytomonospora endophytica]GIG71069.1 hypothetical protein Pen01_73640 [Phytomonospora endophytica]